MALLLFLLQKKRHFCKNKGLKGRQEGGKAVSYLVNPLDSGYPIRLRSYSSWSREWNCIERCPKTFSKALLQPIHARAH